MEKKDDLRDRLFKVTSDFNESQMEESLPSLEQWEHEITDEKESQFFEKREHLRKNVSIHGTFETVNEQFRASTKNVSMGGALIDPEINLSFHEDLHMTFIDSKFNGRVYTKGKVIRVDSDGVGIQFNQVVPAMSSL
jgi:methionyl-tRNA formyltransferase